MGFLIFKSEDREESVVSAQRLFMRFLADNREKKFIKDGCEKKLFSGIQNGYDFDCMTSSTRSYTEEAKEGNVRTAFRGLGGITVDKSKRSDWSFWSVVNRLYKYTAFPIHEQTKYLTDLDTAFSYCRPISEIAKENPEVAQQLYNQMQSWHNSSIVSYQRAADLMGVYFQVPGFMSREDFLYKRDAEKHTPAEKVLLFDDEDYKNARSVMNGSYAAAETGMQTLLANTTSKPSTKPKVKGQVRGRKLAVNRTRRKKTQNRRKKGNKNKIILKNTNKLKNARSTAGKQKITLKNTNKLKKIRINIKKQSKNGGRNKSRSTLRTGSSKTLNGSMADTLLTKQLGEAQQRYESFSHTTRGLAAGLEQSNGTLNMLSKLRDSAKANHTDCQYRQSSEKEDSELLAFNGTIKQNSL